MAPAYVAAFLPLVDIGAGMGIGGKVVVLWAPVFVFSFVMECFDCVLSCLSISVTLGISAFAVPCIEYGDMHSPSP